MTTSSSRAVKLLQVAGCVLFLVSFFLPAVNVSKNDAMYLKGFECARSWVSGIRDLFPSKEPEAQRAAEFGDNLFLSATGWSNVFVPLYLLVPKRRFKRVAAWLTLGCAVTTIVFLVVYKIVPVWGCCMWLASSALVMSPELEHFWRRKNEELEDHTNK